MPQLLSKRWMLNRLVAGGKEEGWLLGRQSPRGWCEGLQEQSSLRLGQGQQGQSGLGLGLVFGLVGWAQAFRVRVRIRVRVKVRGLTQSQLAWRLCPPARCQACASCSTYALLSTLPPGGLGWPWAILLKAAVPWSGIRCSWLRVALGTIPHDSCRRTECAAIPRGYTTPPHPEVASAHTQRWCQKEHLCILHFSPLRPRFYS